MSKRAARVRCEFESTIATDGNYNFLYPPHEGKFIVPHQQFANGDKVRITVTLLKRKERP